MTFWIHALCNEPVEEADFLAMRKGIEERLASLTYLFVPEQEEDPRRVLDRLVIAMPETSDGTTARLLSYRPRGLIPVVREGTAPLAELWQTLHDEMLPKEPRIAGILERLSRVRDDVSFALKDADVRGMGFPLCIAAAAHLVALRGGFIQSGWYSWMIPSGKEVDILLEIAR